MIPRSLRYPSSCIILVGSKAEKPPTKVTVSVVLNGTASYRHLPHQPKILQNAFKAGSPASIGSEEDIGAGIGVRR